MRQQIPQSYEFEEFRLDAGKRLLSRSGEVVPLVPKAFDILRVLVARHGETVSKDELFEAVWNDTIVEENNLNVNISALRKVFNEKPREHRFIVTVPGQGYKFVAEVREIIAETNSESVARTVETKESDDSKNLPTAPPEKAKTEKLFARIRQRPTLFLILTAVSLTLIFLTSSLFYRQNPAFFNASQTAKRYTTNEEAYRLYLQGSALVDKRGRKDAEKAIEYFEQAIKLDPNYAPAYARLANAHTAVSQSGGEPHAEYLKARAAIEKALAIDDNLAEAHSQLGEIKSNYEWDFAGAEREHKKAVALNPNSPAAHRLYSIHLCHLGRFDESIREIKNAIDLEPASVHNHRLYGMILHYARRHDEAVTQLKRTVEMDANFLTTYAFLIGAYRAKGDDAEAFEWFVREQTQSGEKPDEIQSWKAIYAESGWRGIHGRRLEQAKEDEKNGKPNYIYLARLYTELEMREQAFAYLEKAFVRRGWAMASINVTPRFDSLRGDPRFDDLVKRIGLK